MVYAYSKIEYYDFAYIMSSKGYYVDYNINLVSFDDDPFYEKYYFYPFSSSEESHEYMNYSLKVLGIGPEVHSDFVEQDDSSYYIAQWMDGEFERYEYCFEYSGNVICGVGNVEFKNKIKKNIDDLFRDDVFKIYSLDKLRNNLKGVNTSNWEIVLDKLEIKLYNDTEDDKNVSSDDRVSKKRSSFGNFVHLGIGIVCVSILFLMIGIVLLKREKKTR